MYCRTAFFIPCAKACCVGLLSCNLPRNFRKNTPQQHCNAAMPTMSFSIPVVLLFDKASNAVGFFHFLVARMACAVLAIRHKKTAWSDARHSAAVGIAFQADCLFYGIRIILRSCRILSILVQRQGCKACLRQPCSSGQGRTCSIRCPRARRCI